MFSRGIGKVLTLVAESHDCILHMELALLVLAPGCRLDTASSVFSKVRERVCVCCAAVCSARWGPAGALLVNVPHQSSAVGKL